MYLVYNSTCPSGVIKFSLVPQCPFPLWIILIEFIYIYIYVCVCVCMYVYICIYMYVYIYTHTYTHIYTHIYEYIYIYIYIFYIYLYILYIYLYIYFFFLFLLAQGLWKFQDQGSNPHHSYNQSHSSDNARSLTHWVTRELPELIYKSQQRL